MGKTIRVAMDALGGDHGLAVTVDAAAQVSLDEGGVTVLLVGDAGEIQQRLDDLSFDPSRLEVVHAPQGIPMGAPARESLNRWPECSIMTAARLVKEGEADALVSAGHTGATVLAAAEVFSMLPGIRRAALAAVYPTEAKHGPRQDPFALMLDVGATVHATAEELVGFAVMGAAYSSIVSEIKDPRVALLSNGREPNKGTPEIVEAYRQLSALHLNFIGNVEGVDIPRGTFDVVVCDGFLGNVVLKMLEGVGEVMRDLAKDAAHRKVQWRVGLSMLEGRLKDLGRLTDWKTYGGAPLLGFDQVVIKAHGRSEARAIRNAIKVAAKVRRGDLIGRIRQGMSFEEETDA
jgi:glycerol-3-phosphate acyltransferase PlsX